MTDIVTDIVLPALIIFSVPIGMVIGAVILAAEEERRKDRRP